MIILYDCEMKIIIDQVHWIILHLLISVYCLFFFEILKLAWFLLVSKKWLFCMNIKRFLCCIQYINDLVIYLDLYFIHPIWILLVGMLSNGIKKWFFSMIVKLFFTKVESNHCLYTCLYLYFVSFVLFSSSWYICWYSYWK